MDTATARARLRAMVAADAAPVLSADEIDSLLSIGSLADSAGNAPSSTDWTPTYDLNRAATEGWRWKAGKVAGSFDFQADGAQYNRSQMLDMCHKMAAQYQRRVVGSVPVYAPIAATYPVEDDE
jgi:hypothetical protein